MADKAKAERNILRWMVQAPLDAWPRCSVLRSADFQRYRALFEMLNVLIGSYISDRERPRVTEDALAIAAEQFGADPNDVPELFERCHESVYFEALDTLRPTPLTLDEMTRAGRLATVCQHIAEMEAGTVPRDDSRSFSGKPAADIWDIDETVDWLVEGVFSADQPTIFGAKQKSLKTTLLTDLAVSLASGYPWLGRFEIPKQRRVLFITGEASEKAAIRKVKRAAEVGRNLRRDDFTDSLRIEAVSFPTLPSSDDCDAVAKAVESHGVEVVILDPLYMGLSGLNTANLNEVGPVMRQFMQACKPAKLIIAHHVKKTASFDDAPNLEDLSQAGIAEFAGNYWLMGRMSEYTGNGIHQLAIRYGGRDEQFGLLKLDFDEREWSSQFTSLMDHREDLKARRETERINALTGRIEKELGRYPDGMSEYKLAVAVGTQKDRGPFQDALEELEQRGRIVLIPEFKPERSKNTSKGWKLASERLLTN